MCGFRGPIDVTQLAKAVIYIKVLSVKTLANVNIWHLCDGDVEALGEGCAGAVCDGDLDGDLAGVFVIELDVVAELELAVADFETGV